MVWFGNLLYEIREEASSQGRGELPSLSCPVDKMNLVV